ncbi:MAG TPA: DUF2171 domain-containing protein [Allosphingosinicella sp.]|nr:DUF2171 domain-containing protein [Allosphingosinicella sp.]
MAQDHRDERDRRWRGESRAEGRREPPRPERLGDRNARGETDDPDYGAERYGPGAVEGYGGEGYVRPSDPDKLFSGPGYDAGFAGPRFDRLDVGSVGSHGVHPVSSAFGADYRGAIGVTPGGGYGSSARRYAIQRSRQESEQAPQADRDRHYAEWRRRQVEQLDRDYEDYRRERQSRFDDEFGQWHERRGRQRQAIGRVAGKMEVVGSDGGHVGTVDGSSGDSIVLARDDGGAGGHHHSIPCGWIDSVDDKVRLNLGAEEAMRRWRDVEGNRALFERDGGGQDSPKVVDRGFSGTHSGRGQD